MTEQDCFFFGTIFKLHGYKGDVNIYNDNNISLNFADIEFFYIKDNNELIPYFSENIRNKKKNTTGIITDGQVRRFNQKKIYANS